MTQQHQMMHLSHIPMAHHHLVSFRPHFLCKAHCTSVMCWHVLQHILHLYGQEPFASTGTLDHHTQLKVWHAGLETLTINGDSAETQAAADTSSNQGTDSVKKVRNLQKKLKQIQQLKDKRDARDGSVLTPEQMQKLESEPSVTSELHHLEQCL